MKRAVLFTLLLVACGCAASPRVPDASPSRALADTFPEAAAAIRPSVVLFRMRIPSDDPKRKGRFDEAYGSGFVAASGRSKSLVVTVAHVVDQARDLRVETDDRRTAPARTLATDSERDLALVRVDIGSLRPVRFGRAGDVALGTAVGVAGYPIPDAFEDEHLGVGLSVFGGRVAAVRRGTLELDVPIIPGESGGPIFLATSGDVIGLAESRFDEERAIGFAVPLDAIRRFLAKNGRAVL